MELNSFHYYTTQLSFKTLWFAINSINSKLSWAEIGSFLIWNKNWKKNCSYFLFKSKKYKTKIFANSYDAEVSIYIDDH